MSKHNHKPAKPGADVRTPDAEPTDAAKAPAKDPGLDTIDKADAVEQAKDAVAEPGHQQLDDLGTKIPEAVPGAAAGPNDGTTAAAASVRKWEVSVPNSRLPVRTVEAESKSAAIHQYKADLGITDLPNAAEAHPAE